MSTDKSLEWSPQSAYAERLCHHSEGKRTANADRAQLFLCEGDHGLKPRRGQKCKNLLVISYPHPKCLQSHLNASEKGHTLITEYLMENLFEV